MSPTLTHPGTGKYERLLERCRGLSPIPTAVAYPCEEVALAGAIDAGAQGLIAPILVGPAATIAEIAKAKGLICATLLKDGAAPSTPVDLHRPGAPR